MLALKIILFVILFWVLLIAFLLLLPAKAKIVYKDNLDFAIKYCGFRIYDSKRPKKEKASEKSDSPPQKKTNFFKKAYNKYGLVGAVKHYTKLVKQILKKTAWILKKVKIRNFKLFLAVTADNAADCAIEYGAVCAVLYPTLSFLSSIGDCKFKKIDILADYDSKSPRFELSADIKASLIFILVVLWNGFSEYKKYEGVNTNE